VVLEDNWMLLGLDMSDWLIFIVVMFVSILIVEARARK